MKKNILEVLKEIKKDDLAELTQDYNNLLSIVDNYTIANDEIETLHNFIINCVNNNDNIINNYYIYNYSFTPKAYDLILNLARNNNAFNVLYYTLYNNDIFDNESIKKFMYESLKNNIKGLRDTTPLEKLIGEYLKVNFYNNDDVSRFVEMFTPKVNKYILFIGNTPLAQLTSSYSNNYSSCYNLEKGEYRASNIYLMNDYNNHIIKVFEYNNTNLNMIESDALKYSDEVISRFNAWIDKNNKYVIVAKNYGDTSYYSNSASNRKTLVNAITSELYGFSSDFIDTYDARIRYCDDFEGYRDYINSFRFASDNLDNNINITIGASDLINWNIDKSDMIINCGLICCACCGDECNEDDLCYCEDTNDYRCYDCCWYCDDDSCYYSNNIAYVEIPNGYKYKLDDCYIGNN